MRNSESVRMKIDAFGSGMELHRAGERASDLVSMGKRGRVASRRVRASSSG
jgi:hypothetical protein